jgi:hypothetical protein
MRKGLRFVIRGENSHVNRHLLDEHEVREGRVQRHLPILSTASLVREFPDFSKHRALYLRSQFGLPNSWCFLYSAASEIELRIVIVVTQSDLHCLNPTSRYTRECLRTL